MIAKVGPRYGDVASLIRYVYGAGGRDGRGGVQPRQPGGKRHGDRNLDREGDRCGGHDTHRHRAYLRRRIRLGYEQHLYGKNEGEELGSDRGRRPRQACLG